MHVFWLSVRQLNIRWCGCSKTATFKSLTLKAVHGLHMRLLRTIGRFQCPTIRWSCFKKMLGVGWTTPTRQNSSEAPSATGPKWTAWSQGALPVSTWFVKVQPVTLRSPTLMAQALNALRSTSCRAIHTVLRRQHALVQTASAKQHQCASSNFVTTLVHLNTALEAASSTLTIGSKFRMISSLTQVTTSCGRSDPRSGRTPNRLLWRQSARAILIHCLMTLKHRCLSWFRLGTTIANALILSLARSSPMVYATREAGYSRPWPFRPLAKLRSFRLQNQNQTRALSPSLNPQ